ncbi:MAG: hypothetical protein AAFQ36_00615 [Pseudomonadota bacterium]
MFDHTPTRPLFALVIGPDVRLARGALTKLKRPVDVTVLTKPDEIPNGDADEHVASDVAPFTHGSFDVVIAPPAYIADAKTLVSPGGQLVQVRP